jgi:hypothetical protein
VKISQCKQTFNGSYWQHIFPASPNCRESRSRCFEFCPFNVLLWIILQVNNILSAIKRKKSMDTLILSLVASVCTFLILIYWITKWGCILWWVLNLCKPFCVPLLDTLNSFCNAETIFFQGTVIVCVHLVVHPCIRSKCWVKIHMLIRHPPMI